MDANLPEELADRREDIIEKSFVTNGVRAIRNEIVIQKMLLEKMLQIEQNKGG